MGANLKNFLETLKVWLAGNPAEPRPLEGMVSEPQSDGDAGGSAYQQGIPTRNGLSRGQKIGLAVGVPLVLFASYVGFNVVQNYVTSRKAEQPVAAATVPSPQQTQAPLATQTPIPGLEKILSDQQIKDYVIELSQNQPITQSVLDKINAVNSSLYYKFTGNTFEQVKFVPMNLSGEEYKKLQDAGEISKTSAGTIGFSPDGKTLIYVNVESTNVKGGGPLEVLKIQAREIGQAESRRVNNAPRELYVTTMNPYFDAAEKLGLTELTGDIKNPKISLSTVAWESLLTLYQAAVVHYLEELEAITAVPISEEHIDNTVDGIIDSYNKDISYFIPQSSLLDWIRAFEREDTSESLLKYGRITSQQALSLFNHHTQRLTTREGLEETVVEIANSVRDAPKYAQRIKDAVRLSQRHGDFIFFP